MMTMDPATMTSSAARGSMSLSSSNNNSDGSSRKNQLPMSTGLADFVASSQRRVSSTMSTSNSRNSLSSNNGSSHHRRTMDQSSRRLSQQQKRGSLLGSNSSLSSMGGSSIGGSSSRVRLKGSASVMGLLSVMKERRGEEGDVSESSHNTDGSSFLGVRRTTKAAFGSSSNLKKSGSKSTFLAASQSANALADALLGGGKRRVKKSLMGDSSATSHGSGNATWNNSSSSSRRHSGRGKKASNGALFGNLLVGVGPSSSQMESTQNSATQTFSVNSNARAHRPSLKQRPGSTPLANVMESSEIVGEMSALSPANRSALRGSRNSKTANNMMSSIGTVAHSHNSQMLGSALGRKSGGKLVDSDDDKSEDSDSTASFDDSSNNNLEHEMHDVSTRLPSPPSATRSRAARPSILGRTAQSAMGFMGGNSSFSKSLQSSQPTLSLSATAAVATAAEENESRSPVRRTKSGRESLLGRRQDRDRDGLSSLSKTLTSTSNLALKRTVSGTAALKRTVSSTGALVTRTGGLMGKTLRTKSGSFDLKDMQKGLAGATSRSTPGRSQSSSILGGRYGSGKEAEPDELISDIVKWSPLDPEDRARYEEADVTVKRLLRRKPDAVRAMYDFRLGGRGNPTVKRYPLSHLVAMGASEQVVRLAIKACPQALQPTKDFRSTALHTACSFNTPLEVVKCIYQKHPEAIKQTTNYVYLPLHNACQTSTPEPCSLELVKFLVEAYPSGLMAMNKLGDTPLRTAQRNEKIGKDVLEYLENETERVLNLVENAGQKKSIEERQAWGSKEIRNSNSNNAIVDDTDHSSTVSLGFTSVASSQNLQTDLSDDDSI